MTDPETETPTKANNFERLVALRDAARNLNHIVEGMPNERWACDGVRLKDTREWCAFYVALKRATED